MSCDNKHRVYCHHEFHVITKLRCTISRQLCPCSFVNTCNQSPWVYLPIQRTRKDPQQILISQMQLVAIIAAYALVRGLRNDSRRIPQPMQTSSTIPILLSVSQLTCSELERIICSFLVSYSAGFLLAHVDWSS